MGVKDEERVEKYVYNENDSIVQRINKDIKTTWDRPKGISGTTIKGLYGIAAAASFGVPLVFLPAPINIIVAGVLETVCFVATTKFIRFLYPKKKILTREDRNGLEIDTTGSVGTAGAAEDDKDEMEDIFQRGDYANILGNICGIDPNDSSKLLSVRRSRGMNGNVIIFGSPGSGKSVGIAIPTIMQTIRRGESLIVTDPKGELYEKTSLMAKKNGYTVKILNLAPKMMMYSDGCDFMSTIHGDDLVAGSIADAIIMNSSDGNKLDFFDKSEGNLLDAMLILHSEEGSPYEATLPAVYKHICQSSAEDLSDMFDELDWESAAMGPGSTYASMKDTVQGDTKAGLGIRLKSLNNKLIQKVTGTHDIDFTLPGREKCIYYIVSDDTDPSLNFYQSLFFTLLFRELKNYADYETGDAKSLPVKVTFLLDEFPSVGHIPGFSQALSTFRGRNMDIMIILQNLGQLQKMYPENEWASIIDECSTMYILRTNEVQITAKYISERSGLMGVVTHIEEDGESVGKQRISQRNVLNPDEVIRLKNDEMLVITSGHNVAKVKKHYYFNHPMCKELRDTHISSHAPTWLQDVMMYGTEKDKRRYGIKTEEDIIAWAEKISLENELLESIELCTEEDFKQPWKNSKQKKLDQKIYGKIIEKHLMKDKDEKIIEDNAEDLANMMHVG